MLRHASESHSLRLNTVPLHVDVTFGFPIHPSKDLGYLHLSAIVNSAAVHIGVQITVQAPAFSSLGSLPTSGITGSCSNFMFDFCEALPYCLPQLAALFYILMLPNKFIENF